MRNVFLLSDIPFVKRLRKKVLSKFLLPVAVLLTNSTLTAQVQISLERPKLASTAPEAASVQKYLDYPVDHSVGIPDISIPLYEIRMGDLTLPITLSYHSSGMKPKEHGGRIAKGWTLKAEPSVSRTIKGIADDATRPYLESGYFERSHRPSLQIDNQQELEKEMVRRVVDKEWDGESDIYYYNLNPGGGKAYANYNAGGPTIYLVPYPRTNDQIICNRVYAITGFDVITAQGVKYQFGNGSYTRERWGDDVTRWMCNRISSAKTKAEITFAYYSGNPNLWRPDNYWQMNHTLVLEDSITNNPNPYPFNGSYPSAPTTPYPVLTQQTDGYNREWQLLGPTQNETLNNSSRIYLGANTYDHTQTIEVSELQTIYFGQNRMEFYYNNDGLNKIEVTGAGGETIRTINLFTAKYNTGTSHTKLDSIRISAPGCEPRMYRFKYLGESLVPPATTYSIDHWGYSNGPGYTNQFTVPTIKTKTYFYDSYYGLASKYHEIPGANREPDPQYAMAGILYQVTNPDGAITNFQYAGNTGAFLMYYRGSWSNYLKYSSYLYPVGGLRVEKITTTDPLTNKTYSRLFEYGLSTSTGERDEPILGGGAIKHIITDRDYCWERIQKMGDYQGGVQRTSRIRSWGSMPISEITFNNGSPVIYNFVREFQYGPDEPQVIKTQYRYSATLHNYNDIFLWDDYYGDSPKLLPLDYVYNSKQLEATRKSIKTPYDINDNDHGDARSDVFDGQLEKKEIFRNDTLIASTEYVYEKKWNDLSGGRGVVIDRPFRSLAFFPDTHDTQGDTHKKQRDEFTSGYYTTPQAKWNMATVYWKALVKETNKLYDYSNGQQKVLATVKDYLYPQYNINPYQTITQNSSQQTIVDSMGYNKDYADVLAHHKTTKGGAFSESHIDFVSGTTRPSVVSHRTSLAPTFEDEVTYHAYDDFGNVAEVSSKDGVHTVYIWGYNNQYLLAEIVSMTYAELRAKHITDPDYLRQLANRPQPLPYDLDMLNALRTAMPNSMVTTYTYKPLIGLSTVCDANGKTTYYEYDGFGRLNCVKDQEGKVLKTIDYKSQN